MNISIEDVKVYKVINREGKVFLVLGISKKDVEDYVKEERCQFDCHVHQDFKVEENLDKEIYFYIDDLNIDCFSMKCDWSKYTYKADTMVIEDNMSDLVAQYHKRISVNIKHNFGDVVV